jgi:AraC-like DNA-binding protein
MPNDSPPIHANSYSAKLIHAVILLLQHQGINIKQALEHIDIAYDEIDTPGQRYPIDTFEKLLQYLVISTGDEKMAILSAEAVQPRMLGSVGFVMTTANTLQDAYLQLENYISLIYEGINISVTHDSSYLTIELDFEQDSLLVNDFFICALLNWPRWLTGQSIPALYLSLTIDSASAKAYHPQLATNVDYSQAAIKLVFSNKYMRLTCLEASSEMHQLHCKYADSLMLKSSQKYAVIAQTKYHIRKILERDDNKENNAIKRQQIAQSLNMSLRTFQRKLNALDTSFQALYDAARKETCLQLIHHSDINLGRITYKLGYANLSAFQKAFRRWMGTSPSEYRKNLTAQQLNKQNKALPAEQQQWHTPLNKSKLIAQLHKRINDVGSFSQELLLLTALLSHNRDTKVAIEQVVKISGNSIARLSIYLWPLQQQELIDNIDNLGKEQLYISIISPLATTQIINLAPPRDVANLYFKMASEYQNDNINAAIEYYQQCNLQYLDQWQIEQLYHFCTQLKAHPQYLHCFNTLSLIYPLLIACEEKLTNNQALLNQFNIEQLETWLELSLFENIYNQYRTLQKSSLNNEQQIRLAIITAQLHVEMNKAEQAITLLQDTAKTLCNLADIPNEHNAVLADIAIQIDYLENSRHTNNEQNFINNTGKKITDHTAIQLNILQHLITISLQNNKLITAAGAITMMFKLSLISSNAYFSAFAAAHFAWVAHVFANDLTTTKICRHKAIHLSTQHSERHLALCETILLQHVELWLTPVTQLKNSLQHKIHHDTTNAHYRLDILILAITLNLCSGTALSSIKTQCLTLIDGLSLDIHSQQTINDIINMIDNITLDPVLESQLHFDRKKITNHHSNITFALLFKAFYNFETALWPSMQFLDAKIESEITNSYLLSEAVFMCSIMRIYCLKTQQKLSTYNYSRAEADKARFKTWSAQCPANFSAQYAILNAISSYLLADEQQSIKQFEIAIKAIKQFGYLHHQILYYHFYARVLSKNQPTLSTLCKDKEKTLRKQWLNH